MQPRRWVASSVAAVLLATLPGILVIATDGHGLERAEPTALGSAVPGAVSSPSTTAASTTTAAPTTATAPVPLSDEVAIVPPSEPMTGEVAAASHPVSQPFAYTEAGSGEVMALIVGIDDYPGRRHDLDAAVADADTVNSALRQLGVPEANRVVLRNGQARRSHLVAALQALVQRAGSGTTVVFAYAGHVQKMDRDTEAIITADGKYLTDTDLATILAPARAERMWLLIASCYAAGFTEALAPGRVLTAAAGANSLAYESPSLNGSYLVHHMVREGWLEGRAGNTVQEAFAYADAVTSSRYSNRRPVQIDRGDGPLSLGDMRSQPAPYTPSGSSRPSSAPTTAPTVPPTTTTTAPERRCTLIVLC